MQEKKFIMSPVSERYLRCLPRAAGEMPGGILLKAYEVADAQHASEAADRIPDALRQRIQSSS